MFGAFAKHPVFINFLSKMVALILIYNTQNAIACLWLLYIIFRLTTHKIPCYPKIDQKITKELS
jgi:hypothetical protein